MKFENKTNPGQLPVDGDIVIYERFGREVTATWSENTFHNMLDIQSQSDQDGISPVAFRRLFTLTEQVAMDNAEYSDSLTSEQKAMINTAMSHFRAAQSIDLGHPDVETLLGVFVSTGLLAAERVPQILTAVKPE